MPLISIKEKLMGKAVETLTKRLDEPPVMAKISKKLSECKVALVYNCWGSFKESASF